MTVAKLDLRDQELDLDGFLLAGGKIYTYAANTLTPLATYADVSGSVANANPIVADSSGQLHIWLTAGLSYKFVYKDANSVTLYTENGISIADTAAELAAAASQAFDLAFDFLGGPPTASQEMFRYAFTRAVSFPANFSGSFGSVSANPTASFVETVKKNGSTVGAITTNTSGVSSFASSGGAVVSFAAGDVLTVSGPALTDATVANLARTFAGALA